MTSSVSVSNERTANRSRITKNGQKITYSMQVIQHPTQARACGSGPKSNTDRRPVDPPPIISLHVYEGEGPDATDITFSYRANFFVWASLEFARPVSHSRGSQPQANTPVLCGTPVAGISYLERPEAAGYFIFPDLSVRHEGYYRINFTLFEDLKDMKYEDEKDSAAPIELMPGTEFVNCRCEVKSTPFQVYSAKKFPGLSESTSLSRIVAEQGCRVRIRRDVRMRKRETKGSRDWDEYEDDTADLRLKHNSSPGLDLAVQKPAEPRGPSPGSRDRLRSNSVTSNTSAHPQSVHQPVQDWLDNSRPFTGIPPPGSHVPHSPTSTQYHRQDQANMSSYAHSQYLTEQQIAQSPQQMMNPQMTPFGMQNPWVYASQASMQSPVYGQSVNHLRHSSLQYASPSVPDYMSSQYDTNQPQSSNGLGIVDTDMYGRPTQSHYSSYATGRQTPMAQGSYGMELPPLRTSTSQSNFDRHFSDSSLSYPQSSSYIHQPPLPEYGSQPTNGMAGSKKRSYASTFGNNHHDQSLRDGARPGLSNGMVKTDNSPITDEDSQEIEGINMSYRRADGTVVERQWPVM